MASTQTQLPIEPHALSGVPASTSHKSEPADAHLEVQTFRDSRVIDCQTPIPEEDENNETASEPPEPVTPTSDTAPPPFHHEGAIDSGAVMPRAETKLRPLAATPAKPHPTPRSQPTTTADATQYPKPGLGKRVGSFVRNKLHRTPSAEPNQPLSANADVTVSNHGNSSSETNGILMPTKPRRLSSFSLSGRNTPKSSQSNTPPSPSSPSSTISHDLADETARPPRHSLSSTGISSMNSPRPGITWGSAPRGDGKPLRHPRRRRSASTDQVPTLAKPRDDATVGLVLDPFSRPAAEGVGMKSRRLSTSLPDEFTVDHVELDKEFKSSSLMPGKRGKLLGKGATAQVRIMARRGANNGEEQLVAVKEFRDREKNEDEGEYIKKIKSEYSIAKSLHHPNIVDTVRLCTHNGKWNHVMEFCNYGEIYSLVERKLFASDGYYSQADRLCIFKQLIRGVDYLHSHGIAHRDIKLENLLLNKDGHLKISDFGVAEVFSGEHPGLRAAGGECGKNMGEVRLSKPGICGSLPYIAPEVLEKRGSYDPRPLDIWSCAIVFLTMTCGGCPWEAAKPEWQHYAKFKTGWDNWLPNHPDGQLNDGEDGYPKCGKLFSLISPPPIKRLLLKMLHPLPDKRIKVRDIINMTYFKNIECCCPESFEDREPCCIDVSQAKKGSSKMLVAQKKHLHRHIPPKPEKRVAKAFQHRFDMGEGWS